MKSKDYNKFLSLMHIEPPPPRRLAALEAVLPNWLLLHPFLAELKPDLDGLQVCRYLMFLELNREETGPRYHVMDRLYKRYSNLRREMETAAMGVLIEEEVPA